MNPPVKRRGMPIHIPITDIKSAPERRNPVPIDSQKIFLSFRIKKSIEKRAEKNGPPK